MIRSRFTPPFAILILGSPTLAQPVWPPPYAAIEVQSEHVAAVNMSGINNDGVVAGSLSGPNVGFMWHRGGYRLLEGINPAFQAAAGDINDWGWVVGYGSDFVHSAPVPTLWIDGEPMSLGTLGGEWGVATAINDGGRVVGWSKNADDDAHAFLWRDGEMIDLGTLGASVSWAWGMNNVGQVVGHSFDPNLIGQRGFLWDNGAMIDIGTLPDGAECRALGINDLGQIVGQCQDADRNRVAFLWENGTMRSIHDNHLGIVSTAKAINNRGQVIGFADDDSLATTRAFIWDADSGMRDIQDLCPPNMVPRRWNPADINEHGQITVSAQRGNPFNGGRLVSLFLTPVNPTMVMSEPSPGIAGVANTLSVTNATPGATVRFFYSLRGGGEIIPGCATRLNALQLANPTVIGSAVANENGVATITRPVPLIARGQTILFQAVVQDDCAISQLVGHQFE